MLNLIRKELALCMHPTAFIFLSFAVLVFVPNYPYEVIFFFSCLSVFFCCMMGRENGDIAFSCALPVKKEHIPLAKMLVIFGLQGIILLLVGIIGAVKGAVLPAEQYVNQGGDLGKSCFGRQWCGIARRIQPDLLSPLFQSPRKDRRSIRDRRGCRVLADRRFHCFTLGNAPVFRYAERAEFCKHRSKSSRFDHRDSHLYCYVCDRLQIIHEALS